MKSGSSGYLSTIEKIVALLLLIYPTFMLTVKGGMNGIFAFLLLLALAVAVVRPADMSVIAWKPEWTYYVAAMLSMTAAILITQSHLHNFSSRPYDAVSRYWLAIPIFLLLHRLRPNVFFVLQFAFPVAATIGLLLIQEIDASGRYGISTLDLIHFGDFELILGVLSLFSINWFKKDPRAMRILKVLGFVAGLTASFASGSRGGWLALPVFIAIFFYFKIAKIPSKTIVVSLLSMTLTASLLHSFNANIHQRVGLIFNETALFEQGKRDTSVGVRWQLYQAALDIFKRHPIFGVGPQGFALEMEPMVEAGKLTPAAGKLGEGEVHNDILSKAAGMGIFGLIAILAVYFVPLGLFWKSSKSSHPTIKRTGILGITFVSGILVFGLTVEFLNLTMAVAFYSFTVAVLLAVCYNVHHRDNSLEI